MRQRDVVGQRLLAHLLVLGIGGLGQRVLQGEGDAGPVRRLRDLPRDEVLVVLRARPRQGVGGLDAFLVDVAGPLHDLLHLGGLDRLVLAVLVRPADTVGIHEALHDAVPVRGAVPALAHAVEVVLRPVQRGRSRLRLLERLRQLDLLLLELVAPDVPEGRHDVPRDRVGLAADDGDRRHVGGRLADLTLDLAREAGEVEQLAHAREARGRPRLQLPDVGRVLVLDGGHVLRLHVLEREVLDRHLGAVLLRPSLGGRLDLLVGGLHVGLEDPEPQAGAFLHLRRRHAGQRQRRGGADGAGQEVSSSEPSVPHEAPPWGGCVEIRPGWREYRPARPAVSRRAAAASDASGLAISYLGVAPWCAAVYLIMLGSHSESHGTAMRIARRMMSATMKGMTPLKTVPVLTWGRSVRSTNMFMPTGGLIRPISTTHTMTMPNHTGSKPSCTMTGKKTGIVSRIMDSSSMAVPSST